MQAETLHQPIVQYIQQHQDRFLAELMDWLRIPSISADSQYQGEVRKAGDWLLERFRELELDEVCLLETSGFPVVYGSKTVSPEAPTVLIYGHYDVQPPDPLELWTSPAFEPVVKDGKVYARGAADDKGQVYMHVKAIETLLAIKALPCNIKFFIEGEEEVGSPSLEEALVKYADKLACDVVLVSDTSMIANDTPSLTVSLRGLAYMEVEVTGPNRDLHSGVYGGAVANPINVLCEMLASLKDPFGRVMIPGFYKDVENLRPEERAEFAKVPFEEKAYLEHLDIAETQGEEGYSILEQTSTRPTLDINGIWGGYTGEGAKTVIASKAYAKVSMRLVPNQDPLKISNLFAEHFTRIAPKSVKVKVTAHHGGQPFVTQTDSPAYQAAIQALTQSFGKAPLPMREGGSIPILTALKKHLNAEVVLMGFGLNSDAIHSPNEHYGLFNFYKGIESISLYYPALAAQQ
jgi:acetylornithine deacetylase/succinyl-diaminopimelate desuccinylase-like protein